MLPFVTIFDLCRQIIPEFDALLLNPRIEDMPILHLKVKTPFKVRFDLHQFVGSLLHMLQIASSQNL